VAVDLIARYAELTAEGILQIRRGDFRHAVDNFEEARQLAGELQDPQLHVKALCNLSTARLAVGDVQQAEKGLREILLKTHDLQMVYHASSNLASALRRQGRLEKALPFARRALQAAIELDDPVRKAASHNLIANIHLNMNYLDEAMAEYRHALALNEQGAAGRDNIDCIKENLGYCLLLKKRIQEGIAVILEALQIATANQNVRCIAECNQDLSFAYMQTRELEQAEVCGEKALALALEYQFVDFQKNCYYLLGEINLLLGNEEKSDHYFDRLQELYPHLPVLKDFLRSFDVSSIISLKNPF
jgi:tetratricopeptide (TPR) repeat protein